METQEANKYQVIRDLRLKKNISVAQLSQKTGITKGTLFNYEAGRTEPSFGNLLFIAKSLDEMTVTESVFGFPQRSAESMIQGPAPQANIPITYNCKEVVSELELKIKTLEEEIRKHQDRYDRLIVLMEKMVDAQVGKPEHVISPEECREPELGYIFGYMELRQAA